MDTLSLSPERRTMRVIKDQYNTLIEAAKLVLDYSDINHDYYDGATPVEKWALYALECALKNDHHQANRIISYWKDLPWDVDDLDDDEEPQFYRSEFRETTSV